MEWHKTLSSFVNEVSKLGLVQNKLTEKIIIKRFFQFRTTTIHLLTVLLCLH